MRRSSAPSSLPGSKRPRFQTPFLMPPSQQQEMKIQDQENMHGATKPVESAEMGPPLAKSRLQETLSKIRKHIVPTSSSSTSSTSSDISPHHPQSFPPNASTVTYHHTPLIKHTPLCPVSSSPPVRGGINLPGTVVGTKDDGCGQRYYNVMWCKRSNKKHKTWEGDAVLIVQGSKVSLKDMDGKDIGNGLGYRKSEVSDLTEGSTLIIGGKEIEVMSEINDEDWKSGKCFTGAGGDDDTVPLLVKKPALMSTKRLNPFQSRHNEQGPPLVSPLFDPTLPGALVVPRPNPKHQLEYNSRGLSLIDVVVDPHLSTHLRPHQREGVVFLYECLMGMREFHGHGAILADEMGLGKTLQCITIVWTLLKQGPYGCIPIVKKIIIVTPGSLVKNWEREFRKWLGTERLKVYSVSGDVRAEGFVKSPLYPVLIISYEMFLRSHDALKGVNFDLLICDEGHRLKNTEAKTTSVIGRLPVRKRILLTGTPIQNDLQEFYSIIDFCNPSVLGSHSAFQKVYERPILLSRQPGASPEEKEVGTARAEELKRLTSLFCLRRTQDIINRFLPPKVDNIVFCRMTNLQLSLYKHLLSSRLIRSCLTVNSHSSSNSSSSSSSKNHHFPPHLVCIGALKKLCNSPSLTYEAAVEKRNGGPAANATADEDTEELIASETIYSNVLEVFPDGYDSHEIGVGENGCGKLVVLSEMLHQLFSTTKEKVVIISNYTQMLDVLERFCVRRGYSFLRLDGSTPSTKRQGIVERFNSKHGIETVFLLSSKAGGVGLNLIGGSRLILYDIDWNPANDLQAMARVWRDGQKRKVHIYRLLTTGSIEEKIFQRQITKQGLNTLLDFHGRGGGGGNGQVCSVKFTREELRDLFTLREDTLCDTHDLVRRGCGRDEGQGSHTHRDTTPGHTSGMDELLQWHHYPSPINHTSLSDELLIGGASSRITYVFQTETIKE